MSKGNEESNQKSKTRKYIAIILLLIIFIIFLLLFNRRYEVVFDENGGSQVDEVTVLRNHKVTEPKDPVRDNYEFAGWYYNDELYDFSKPVTKDIVLEARWVVKASGATLKASVSSLSLVVGASTKIDIASLPDGVTKDMLTYKSSDTNIITIDKNGKITAVKEGSAYVTITTPTGESVKVKVIVTKETIKVTGISLNKTNVTLNVGDTLKLTATIKPNDATNKAVTWKSSNTNVVTVSQSGKLTAVGEGTATITVTSKDGSYKATCKVTVIGKEVIVEDTTVKVTGVSLNKTNLDLIVGDTITLTATVKPSNATNKNVTWTSSNTNVATVDSAGNIKALNPGTTTIIVKTADGGYTATCVITVKEKEASYTVIIEKKEIDVINATYQYSISVTKNGSSFSGYQGVEYNGTKIAKGQLLASSQFNDNIKLAKVYINGTPVTATVVYK